MSFDFIWDSLSTVLSKLIGFSVKSSFFKKIILFVLKPLLNKYIKPIILNAYINYKSTADKIEVITATTKLKTAKNKDDFKKAILDIP